MKKYSAEDFERKYRILFDKLRIKEGFLDEVKKTRKRLGLPESGFGNELELAGFFISKMNGDEFQTLKFFAFLQAYEQKHKQPIGEENRKDAIEAFLKEQRKEEKLGMLPMVYMLAGDISNHHQMLTKSPYLKKKKALSKLFPETIKLIRKFWALDLLDEHIMGHLVEKYLFLGEYGVNRYIQSKVVCSNCRYIGVNHFSPMRNNMEGQDKGPYTEGYIFNKDTVKLLSLHFNSVFLIVKPYATKEETLQYIEDNWNDLKEHIIEKNTFYKQYDVHPSKIKESDTDKNQLIYEMYKQPKKDLLKENGELLREYKDEKDLSLPGIYKETVIAAILKEKYDIKMFPDAVKKAAARFAKSTKLKKQPKDIGDI